MKFLLLLLVLVAAVPALGAPSTHDQNHAKHARRHAHHKHAGHTHRHDKEHPLEGCGQTKSSQLMLENEAYRVRNLQENKRADEFVTRMKKNKDRSFRKDVKPFRKNNRNNRNTNADRRNLFSEYDDEIDSIPVVRIPVIYHVLYSNANGNLPDAQLESQITVLNNDFRATNAEVEAGEVDGVFEDRVGDTKLEYYLNDTFRVAIDSDDFCTNESLFKRSEYGGSDAINPKYFLNVWICNITDAGLLGYAYQPCLLDTDDEWRDGLVLGTDNVGSKEDDVDGTFWFPEGTTYNLGRTGTHEIGHYLNLNHIWGTNEEASCDDSDRVSDTPASLEANYGCPDNTTNTCYEVDPELQKDLRDMYENFMDYSNDECMFMFTEEQVWRMRTVVSGRGCRRELYYAGAQLEGDATLMPSSERTLGSSMRCSDGCIVSEDFIDDGSCDCSDCEDEADYTCDSCGGCPTVCGGYQTCLADTGSGGNDSEVILYVVVVIIILVILVIGAGTVWYVRKRRQDMYNSDSNEMTGTMGADYARMDANGKINT